MQRFAVQFRRESKIFVSSWFDCIVAMLTVKHWKKIRAGTEWD